MADEVGRAWQELGAKFSDLGRALKGRMDEPDAQASSEVRNALQQLADAASALASRAGDTVRDPAVRDQAKDVGRALTEALSRTFESAGEEISSLFRRGKGGEPPAG